MPFKTQSYMTICETSLFFFIQHSSELPEGATVPALGLSNKAVFEGMVNEK